MWSGQRPFNRLVYPHFPGFIVDKSSINVTDFESLPIQQYLPLARLLV
jgi:hypothetical protein